ncbi:E3 ubiquitin-protein ligase RBBP6-like isoform X4 [Manacus vitellinus]|uniref:E3 ubiquitin-protein ligase RBBP6-like isoform X4 n=1 Tax=Manacus vitellinus TaxID=328815 RepID=UPI00115E1842|nr:E3 ubiquitin-protein ligase RBBP6-like isoform X4 [Manacus vitellinus]
MSCVHYKFSSKLNYDTVTFDGLHISLSDLKRQIMGREKLKAADCDLQITNAQTKEGVLTICEELQTPELRFLKCSFLPCEVLTQSAWKLCRCTYWAKYKGN